LELGYAVSDEVIAPMMHARWLEPLAAFENPWRGFFISSAPTSATRRRRC
jgi:hypothetical protein